MVQVVGRYHILQRIGQGAMANVYKAFDPGINRDLAIKVLKREYSRDSECAARFVREATAAGQLSHPNIVTIYDVGEIEGFPYIAMEYLDGKPLDKAAHEKGKLPIGDVLAIACQLAEALKYAHEVGVVHRDIKPSNIMLGKDGRSIKLLDFGIARVAEGDGKDAVKTQVGQVLGTPRYMSPEQALGRELDGRSDLFSVGVVLYELITGRPAFTGSSAATLALQITQQDPAPIDVDDCPRGLQFIVNKLLAKRPEKRFTGAGLLDALMRERAAYESVKTDGARRNLPMQMRLALAMTAITAVVLTGSIGLVLARQNSAMERVAITSGTSIVSFVASNAALHAVENAARPQEERDWMPVQAFVDTASADQNIAQMLVADREGIIRASTNPALVGAPYVAPGGRRLVRDGSQTSVTSVRDSHGAESFRFSQPIFYANRRFGVVDVSVRKSELQAAQSLAQWLLVGLGFLTVLVVGALSVLAARLVMQPVRRLKAALKDAAAGDLDFRISHRRGDEFGDLFNAFNDFAASMQKRHDEASALAATATIIGPANDDWDLASGLNKRAAQ